jgi:NADH dehydrogenase
VVPEPYKVVILGGGFAGTHCFLGLKKFARRGEISLTLINQEDYFLFTPLLHETVSGRVAQKSIKISLAQLARGRNLSFIRANVHSVRVRSKVVETSSGPITFDFLIVALGAQVAFFGVPGADLLPRLKTANDGENLQRAIRELKKLSRVKKQRIVVIGGGATGVEIACEIADTFDLPRRSNNFDVSVLEGREDILMSSHEQLREAAKRSLKERGVTLLCNCPVRKVEPNAIKVGENQAISYDLAIWTAGVRAYDLEFLPPQPKTSANRLKVSLTLEFEHSPNIFALGDIADGYPMTAQVAVAQSKIAAKNVIAKIREKEQIPFVYSSSGMLFSLGRWMAGAEVKIHLLNKVLYFWGFSAWLFWHAAYLSKIPGIKNRLRLLLDWLFHLR